jgi:hypothetical protein
LAPIHRRSKSRRWYDSSSRRSFCSTERHLIKKRNQAISRSRAAVSASSGASIVRQCTVSESLAHSESAKVFLRNGTAFEAR